MISFAKERKSQVFQWNKVFGGVADEDGSGNISPPFNHHCFSPMKQLPFPSSTYSVIVLRQEFVWKNSEVLEIENLLSGIYLVGVESEKEKLVGRFVKE